MFWLLIAGVALVYLGWNVKLTWTTVNYTHAGKSTKTYNFGWLAGVPLMAYGLLLIHRALFIA